MMTTITDLDDFKALDPFYVVKVGDALEILERPKGKDVDVDEVVELRRVRRSAGYEASSPSP
jgi:hypothetical protein